MKAARLLGILHYLLAHGRTSAPVLADRFEVSSRTILRDMEDLSAMGVPVYAITGLGGGWDIDRRYVLPPGLLTADEQGQVLAALALGQADPALQEKLAALFKGRREPIPWLVVDGAPWQASPQLAEDFEALKGAIRQQQWVTFDYFSQQGSLTHRQVQPARLVHKHFRWYLYGWCQTRQAFRYFKLSRMRQVQVLDQGFEADFRDLQLPDLPSERGPRQVIILRFTPAVAYRVYDDFAGQVAVAEDGHLQVDVDVALHEDFLTYLLSYGDQVEIVAPPTVREELATRAEKLWQHYKP